MPETEIQTFEAPDGVLAYLFLQDHRAYSKGDVAGLTVATGDRLAETFMTTQQVGGDRKKTAICRRATAQDLAAHASRNSKAKVKVEPPLVAVEFETDVGSYRGPGGGRKADVAGFTAKIAAQYCDGYIGPTGAKVGKVAHYFVASKTVDTELDPELEKPRIAPEKKKRRRAALPKSPRTTEVS